ncbi:hypothetical protein ABFS83_04G179800 [Erythranthe nasuta]
MVGTFFSFSRSGGMKCSLLLLLLYMMCDDSFLVIIGCENSCLSNFDWLRRG